MTSTIAVVALAAGGRSAETTHLTERLWWVAGLVLAVLAVYALMWRAWKRRAERHADLPELPPVPPESEAGGETAGGESTGRGPDSGADSGLDGGWDGGPDSGPPRLTMTGRYHGSTSSGDWLDRIVARGLGTRSLAQLTLTGAGVTVRRPGAASFLIPVRALRGARLDRGIAGKVLTDDGLLVIVWEHGGHLLDSGFRADDPDEHDAWVAALTALAPTPASPTPASPAASASTPAPATTSAPTASGSGTTPHDPRHDQEGAR